MGLQPWGIAINSTGSLVYAVNRRTIGSWDGSVVVVDTGSNLIVGEIVVGAYPVGISLSPVGKFIDTTTFLPIAIDIKPGSDRNSIDLKSKGKIPVAILSTEEFDAPSQVDPYSLTFGAIGNEPSLAFCNSKGEDIKGDGLKDLVCHFYIEKAGFDYGDEEGVLIGKLLDITGTPIGGSDSVRIVPCK